MKIPFSPPDIIEEEIAEVVDTLKSGWITTGPKTKRFEEALSVYCGTKRTACLNSATAAAEMTLRLLGIGPGDEVITCAYTYTASASVVCHVGAQLVMVDTAKDSFQMDYDRLEAAITEKTKAIVPVDLGGVPCDYDRIYEIVERKRALFRPANALQEAIGRVIILADAAHALGAEYHGKRVGSIADFTTFSFHAVKNLTTGEGGAATWREIPGVDSDSLYQQYMLLSLHGQNKDALTKTKLGAWEYDIVEPYFKCNMTDMAAALGLSQLKRYESILARRADLINFYNSAFQDSRIVPIRHFDDAYRSSGHLYITRIEGADEEERNKIINAMAAEGVSANVHYKPLPMLTAYKNLGFDINNYPNAYNMYKNEITLPLNTVLTDEQAARVSELLLHLV